MISNIDGIIQLNKFTIYNGAEIAGMEFGKLNFLYKNILPTQGLAMLAGPPKAGKSWFLLNMAKDIIANGSNVFYIAAEDNNRRVKERLGKIGLECPEKLITHAGLSQSSPLPRGLEGLRYLIEIYKKYQPSCIIIDTVSSILIPSKSSKNYDTTVKEYEALRKLAEDCKIAILVAHHTRKKTEASDVPIEQILGSTGITGTVETLMVMDNIKGSIDRKLYVTGKDVEQDEYYLSWNGAGFDFNSNGAIAALGPVQKSVFNYILTRSSVTQSEIVKDLERDQGQISRILSHLIEEDLILLNGKTYSPI